MAVEPVGQEQVSSGVLRRNRVWAGLLNRGVMPSHIISRLVAVKGYI